MSIDPMNIFQDVVGDVETFNYPRFTLEGFHVGGGSPGRGDGDGSMFDFMGDSIRVYTRQKRYEWPRNGSQ